MKRAPVRPNPGSNPRPHLRPAHALWLRRLVGHHCAWLLHIRLRLQVLQRGGHGRRGSGSWGGGGRDRWSRVLRHAAERLVNLGFRQALAAQEVALGGHSAGPDLPEAADSGRQTQIRGQGRGR